jgi:hypothetical protein
MSDAAWQLLVSRVAGRCLVDDDFRAYVESRCAAVCRT